MKFNVTKTAAEVVSDPQVTVPGMAVMPLSMVKKHIVSYVQDITNLVKEEKFQNLEALMDNKVFISYVKAIANYERQLEKSAN